MGLDMICEILSLHEAFEKNCMPVPFRRGSAAGPAQAADAGNS